MSSVTFYLDHVEDATVLITDTIYNNGNWVNENIVNTHDVWIGDFIGRTNDQLIGSVDAVRFSKGILTPDQFLSVVPEPSLVVFLMAGVVMCLARRTAHRGI